MITAQQWTERLDRQWTDLRRQEMILGLCLEDGIDTELADENVARRAADYGASVRLAPAPALLQHARNIRHASPIL